MFSSFQPFSKVAEPFSIGLKPVEPKTWIFRDSDFLTYQKQKMDLYETNFDHVFMAREDTLDAQLEAEQLISDAGGKTEICSNLNLPPLARAALDMQDDLVLMRKTGETWNLVAGSVCFPAHWTLSEKFDRPMETIHGPVPMPPQMHQRIKRIFDSIKPSIPVWRENWSLDNDDELRKEKSETATKHNTISEFNHFYLRTEYQTLHKLPVSGDILFTIGTYIKHLADISKLPEHRSFLSNFRGQILALTDEEAEYKGLKHTRPALINWIETQLECDDIK